MIYFIQNGQNGDIKIGTSQSPKKRLAELQIGTPSKLKLLKTINGNKNDEMKLHQQFHHLKIRGEWFKLSDELLNYIRSKKGFVKEINRVLTVMNLKAILNQMPDDTEIFFNEDNIGIIELIDNNKNYINFVLNGRNSLGKKNLTVLEFKKILTRLPVSSTAKISFDVDYANTDGFCINRMEYNARKKYLNLTLTKY